MSLTPEQRVEFEDAIFDAHFSAQKYLETGKDLHEKLLEVSVQDAIDMLQRFAEEIKEDQKIETYKLHLFVPLQMQRLLELRKRNGGKED